MKPANHRIPFPACLFLWRIILFPLLLLASTLTNAQSTEDYQIPASPQNILKELPFWTGFVDSLWIPVDARFLDASTVVIADMRDSRIVIVDGIQSEMRAVGRRGHGPGEFQTPVGLGVGRNGFYVWDMTAFRFSGFDLTGVFTGSFPVMIPSRGFFTSICVTGWGDVAFVPQMTRTGDKFFGQILFFPSSIDSFWTVDIPCSKLREEKDDPSEPAVCNMTVAWGNEETMLVGFHNDYTIRRYSKAGDILWKSEPLDQQFKASKIEPSGEYGYSILMPNRLTGIWEIEGYGMLVGVGIIEGYQYTGEYFTYVDVIAPDATY